LVGGWVTVNKALLYVDAVNNYNGPLDLLNRPLELLYHPFELLCRQLKLLNGPLYPGSGGKVLLFSPPEPRIRA
jgi:hypothetical protein